MQHRRSYVMPRVRVSLALALALSCGAVFGLALGCQRRAADVTSVSERLGTMSSPCGGNRLARDLDATGDGRLDAADVALWRSLADRAHARLTLQHLGFAPADGYYAGPAAGLPSVFALVRVESAVVDISGVPDERLRELYVESHWLALQTELAAQAHVVPTQTVGGMAVAAMPNYQVDVMRPKDVCTAVLALDLGVYSRAGLEPTAIFDLDSTIWAGNGIDVFLAALIDKRLPKPENNAALRAFLKTVKGVDAAAVERNSVFDNAKILYARSVMHSSFPEDERVSAKDGFYNIVALMRGVTVQDARAAARAAVVEGALDLPAWKQRLFADPDGCSMARIIDSLKTRGVAVYILSATPDVLVAEAGELLGIPKEHLLGSVIESKGGVYTGVVGDNPYAIKDSITRQWLSAPPVLSFGDSPTSDFSTLLEATVAGFMINPRGAFLLRDKQEAGGRLVSLSWSATEGEVAKAR